VTNVEIKHVDLNESMIRAIAKQAEAERLRRAKVINAEGEQQAAEKLVDALQRLFDLPDIQKVLVSVFAPFSGCHLDLLAGSKAVFALQIVRHFALRIATGMVARGSRAVWPRSATHRRSSIDRVPVSLDVQHLRCDRRTRKQGVHAVGP
jgi:hypothetical protein